jgi:hypothetical protein
MRHLRFPIIALAAMALLLVGAASTQATAGIPYTIHGVNQFTNGPGGLCTEGGHGVDQLEIRDPRQRLPGGSNRPGDLGSA